MKQGCPLSPTLFGLLADGLHTFLQAVARADGIVVTAGLTITDLGYVDDLCLVSATADGLQRVIDGADAWCAAVGMQASSAKTLVMELTSSELPWGQWTCSGQPLQVVSEARYLGVTFKAGRGCLPTFASLRSKTLQAWALLWQQYGRLECGRSMWLMLQLYLACVMPAGEFACEVWGVLPLRGVAREARAALAALHLRHLKKLVGLRQSVPTLILLSELRQSLMSDVLLLRAAGFWNSVVASPGMHRQIVLNAVQLAVDGERSGYEAGLVASLRVVGYDMILTAGGWRLAACQRLMSHGCAIICGLVGMRSGRSCMSAPAWRLQPMRVCAHTSGGFSHLSRQPRF